MKKMPLLAVILLILTVATPAMSKVLFYDDCEDYPSITDNGGSDWGLTENGGKLSVSRDQKRAGSSSYKMVFDSGDSGKRVELVLRAPGLKNFEFNKEYWIAWSVFIPTDFVMPDWAVIGQWHKAGMNIDNDCDQAPRPANPAVAQPIMTFLSGTNSHPTMNVRITGQSDYCQPNGYDYSEVFTSPVLKKGAWNDIVIRKVFRYSGKGISQMWLNGEKFIDIQAINGHNDPLPPYLKLGFYAGSSSQHTVYYDEIRIGDGNSSYNEILSKGSSTDPVQTVQTVPKTIDPPTLSIVGTSE